MELLQLTYFCNAAQTENFSRTAENFSVPPSDISQSVKRLEKELGAELFVRHANSIKLNEKGRSFYEKAVKALSLIDDAKAEISDVGERGVLNICINTNRRIIMQTIEKFRHKYPEVDIYTKNGADYTAEKFDLIIDNEYPESSNYKVTKLMRENISLALKRDDPLATMDTLDIKALASRPFVTMPQSQSLFKLTLEICHSLGFTPHIAVQSDDPFYVRKCVELGLGVAFVPEVSWRGQISENICLIRIAGCVRDTYLFFDKTRYMHKSALEFQKMLIDEFEKENNQNS